GTAPTLFRWMGRQARATGRMAWKKSPPDLVETFHAVLPDDPRVERRKMFGFDCAFVNGQMFTGLFEDRMMVRLDDGERAELLALPGAGPFAGRCEPMPGRPMRGYATVPPALVAAPAKLRPWVSRAFAYAVALPAKPGKKASAARKASRKTGGARRR